MRYAAFFFLVCLCSLRVFAQSTLELPTIIFSNGDTCQAYEPTIVRAAQWLEETDLDKEIPKRQEAIDFVLQWLSSCKSVAVEITPPIAALYGRNDALMGIYLSSFSRNTIENRSNPSTFNATRAAVVAMMTVYKKGKDISKSKEMERVIKIEKEGKLEEYIEQVLGISR